MSTTRTAARAKKARSRASRESIPVGLRRRRAYPAAAAFEVRVVSGAARVVVVGRFEDNESWILLDRVV